MLDIAEQTKVHGYNPKRFVQLIREKGGGLGAAQYLLSKEAAQSGFVTLSELRRLDLSVECRVLSSKYADLFTEEELAEARRRLRALDYDPRPCYE